MQLELRTNVIFETRVNPWNNVLDVGMLYWMGHRLGNSMPNVLQTLAACLVSF